MKLVKKILGLKKLEIKKTDLRKIKYSDFPKKIDLVYSARTLHYLKKDELENLFKILNSKLNKNGKVFFSLTGIESEIGNKYPCKKKKMEERFCFLEKEYQERFEIKEKIFLMNLEEFKGLAENYFEIFKI